MSERKAVQSKSEKEVERVGQSSNLSDGADVAEVEEVCADGVDRSGRRSSERSAEESLADVQFRRRPAGARLVHTEEDARQQRRGTQRVHRAQVVAQDHCYRQAAIIAIPCILLVLILLGLDV